MDIDQMKSTAQDHQIELMMMMSTADDMFPELYSAAADSPSSSDVVPTTAAATATTTTTTVLPHFLGGQAPSSGAAFMDIPSSAAGGGGGGGGSRRSVATMREVMFRMAAMQPIMEIDAEAVRRAAPRRRNVRISKDPQSVAARHRRERISERIRILQRIVPGGTKMDTASMLDEAVHYVKFLKTQVQTLSSGTNAGGGGGGGIGFPVAMYSGSYMQPKIYTAQNVEQYRDV